jgi:prohibitin 1
LYKEKEMNKYFIISALLFATGCSVVGPGEKGVRITMGQVKQGVQPEGWYLWVPFLTSVKSISVRIQKSETESEAASKDMQRVTSKLALNWHIDPASVDKIYQTIGDEDDVVSQIINPAVNEVLKAATAKLTAEEILTKRIELKKNIDESLHERLKNYNILVDDVSLVNLTFTTEFNHAVEAKQIAEQRTKQAEYEALTAVQQAKSEVNKSKGEAEAMLTKARAQAEAQKLLKQTLTKDVLKLEYLKKWSGQLPKVMVGSEASIILDLDDENE